MLVPQAPPYSEDEAWTMYFNVQDAVATAMFAKQDVEYYERGIDDAHSQLRDSRERWSEKCHEVLALSKMVEKLQSELEAEKRRHANTEYKSDLYLHMASYFAGSQFNNAVKLAKREQLDVRVPARSCLQLELAVARAYWEMRLAEGRTDAQVKLDQLNAYELAGKELEH